MKSENDKLQILLRNARQILHVVTATFPSFESDGPSQACNESSDDVAELACEWRALDAQLKVDLSEEAKDELLLALPKVRQPSLFIRRKLNCISG